MQKSLWENRQKFSHKETNLMVRLHRWYLCAMASREWLLWWPEGTEVHFEITCTENLPTAAITFTRNPTTHHLLIKNSWNSRPSCYTHLQNRISIGETKVFGESLPNQRVLECSNKMNNTPTKKNRKYLPISRTLSGLCIISMSKQYYWLNGPFANQSAHYNIFQINTMDLKYVALVERYTG